MNIYGISLRPNLTSNKQYRKPKKRKPGKNSKKRDTSKRPFTGLLRQHIREDEPSYKETIKLSSFGEIEIHHKAVFNEILLLNPYLKEQHLDAILKMGYDFSCHTRRWYTENELRKFLLPTDIPEVTLSLDLSPLFVQLEKWYGFHNKEYANYLAALYCDSIVDNDEYELMIEELIFRLSFKDIEKTIRLFTQLNEERFCGYYLKKELSKFFSEVDVSTINRKVQSFSGGMGWEINIHFKKHRGKIREIDSLGGTGGYLILEALAPILTMNTPYIYYDQLVAYLNKHLESNSALIKEFEAYCKKYIEAASWYNDITMETAMCYDLHLGEHLKNRDFWAMAEQSGWVNDINKVIDDLWQYKTMLEEKYK